MGREGEMGYWEWRCLLPSLITIKAKATSDSGSLVSEAITFWVPSIITIARNFNSPIPNLPSQFTSISKWPKLMCIF
jgi:hypothetical protein